MSLWEESERAQQNDVWTIRGDAEAEMTLRTVELIDGALCASARKNNLVQRYMKEKLTLASKQFERG